MNWDEMTGSLEFDSLHSLYANSVITPEEVVGAIYRRIAARGDDHV
jgi:allophanate hydrolase